MKEKDEIIETCECEHTHKNIIDKVRSMMPDEDTVYDVAELFKVFGDSTRTNILMALCYNCYTTWFLIYSIKIWSA